MFNWLFGSVSKLEHNIALENIAELEDRLQKLENKDQIDEDEVERIIIQYLDSNLYNEVRSIVRDACFSIDI